MVRLRVRLFLLLVKSLFVDALEFNGDEFSPIYQQKIRRSQNLTLFINQKNFPILIQRSIAMRAIPPTLQSCFECPLKTALSTTTSPYAICVSRKGGCQYSACMTFCGPAQSPYQSIPRLNPLYFLSPMPIG